MSPDFKIDSGHSWLATELSVNIYLTLEFKVLHNIGISSQDTY